MLFNKRIFDFNSLGLNTRANIFIEKVHFSDDKLSRWVKVEMSSELDFIILNYFWHLIIQEIMSCNVSRTYAKTTKNFQAYEVN